MEEQQEGQNMIPAEESDSAESAAGSQEVQAQSQARDMESVFGQEVPGRESPDEQVQSVGYTGEYGNHIAGEYQKPEQSTYSFSYKNGGGESTHSGDYYAEKPEGTGSDPYQNGFSSSDAEKQQEMNRTSEYHTGTVPEADQEYTNASYFGSSYSSNGSSSRKKKKKESSFGKKLAITAACAVVFGVVASLCFIGVNYVYRENYGTQTSDMATGNEVIKKTTEDEKSSVKEEQSSVADGTVPVQPGTTDVSAIVEQMMPAIVAITSTTKGTDYYDLFGQYYAGQDTTSAGPGFIVGQNEKELLIATNNHVIEGAKTISVQFIDGEIYEAFEKGSDAANDLAVVAVNMSKVKKTTTEEIRVADLGNSETAKVGEMVVAIGNALGYGQSVTVGYISAKDREITEESENGAAGNKIKALQTDAAINPGNSGGALINMQGQVIGINSAKIASSSVEGVGYAIPISVATPIIDDLMKREILADDEKGYLGISGTTVSEAAAMYNVPIGVYVKEVSKGGAADLAGIKANDIITAVNNMQVTTMESLKEKINSYRVGTEVEITFQRSSDGEYKEQKVKVKLQGQSSTDGLTDNSGDGSEQNNNENRGNNDSGNGNDDRGYDDDSFGSLWDFFQ
ncbi:MAG: serine protease [Lachnospiraceae bacterium]|nr:serine protease [Lachnospiraceae bacterium]